MIESMSTYEKVEDGVEKRLAKAAKSKNSTPILKAAAKREEYRDDVEAQEDCRIARIIFDRAEEKYMNGELDWEEMANEIHKSLKAIK